MTSREKKLLLILLLLILFIAGIYYIKISLSEIENVERLEAESSIKLARYQQSEELAKVLKEDKDWVKNNEPEPQEYSKAMSSFQSFISNSAELEGLEYSSSAIKEIESISTHYRVIRSSVMNVRGSNKQMMNWLCHLHKPSKYRAVTSLSIVPDEQDENLLIFSVTVDLFLVESQ